MDTTLAVFLATVAIIVWAPHAIRNPVTFRNAINMLLCSLGLSMASLALASMSNEPSGFTRFIGLAGACASAVSLGLLLFSIAPELPRQGRSTTQDGQPKD